MRRREFVLGVTPTVLVMLLLLALPLGLTLVWSFQSVTYDGPGRWVGLANYRAALADPLFRSALGFTVGFAVCNTALLMVIGYVVALLIDAVPRGKSIFLGILLVPYVLPAVLAATAFSWLFDDNFGGLANLVVHGFGFDPVQWFTQTWPNRLLILLESIWAGVPFFTLIFLAALQGTPQSQIEASLMDGTNWWQRQRYIVIPNLLPTATFIGMISVTNNLGIFDTLVALAPSAQTVGNQSIALYTYQSAFARDQQNLGLGSAVNLMMLLVMVAMVSPLARRAFRDVRTGAS